jgi:1,4-dihydroxy-2-naphthoate polyprenyltransferase
MTPFSAIGVTRPNFLILTPVCISLGLGSVLLSDEAISWHLLAIILLGALMAHISVNALNEYTDFHSGLDAKTDRTPFSGGSGTLVMQPQLAPHALLIGVTSLLITLGCGLYLIQFVGWGLIPIGLLGILIIVSYTGWINRNRFLVLITPGLCFGPLMVVGTHFALTGEYSGTAFLLSLAPFFLVNNLLLLNQIPDIEPDRSVGRDNYAIAWSSQKRALLFLTFCLSAYLAIIFGTIFGLLPVTSLLCLLTSVLSYQIYNGIRDYDGATEQLIPYLGRNVLLTLATPALIFLGIIVSSI